MTRATLIALSLFIAALATVAMVRQAWPHSWYPYECCSSADCKPVNQNEIGESGSDYTYRGLRFPKVQSKVSPDGQFHVCTPTFMGKPYIRCLYRPFTGA